MSTPLMLAAVSSTALLPVAALAGLVMLLVYRGMTSSVAVAALIACSPRRFQALWGYHRPDQYGLVTLVFVGLVMRRVQAAVVLLGQPWSRSWWLWRGGRAEPAVMDGLMSQPATKALYLIGR